MTRRLSAMLTVFLLALGVGCSGPGGGGGEQVPQEGTLQEVADILRASTRPDGRGPARATDLDQFQSVYSRGYQAIKSGDVVVLWGGGMKGEGEAAKGSGEVVAYEKGVPTDGGYVLLTSGEVKKMSASEFSAAPRAGKK